MTTKQRDDGYYWIQALDSKGAPTRGPTIAELSEDWWWGLGSDMQLGREDDGTGEGVRLTVLAGPLELGDAESHREALSTISTLRAQVATLRQQLEDRAAQAAATSSHVTIPVPEAGGEWALFLTYGKYKGMRSMGYSNTYATEAEALNAIEPEDRGLYEARRLAGGT